ncbi:MAG: NAD-dependent malic enzyme [Acidimicrobiia bacterium]
MPVTSASYSITARVVLETDDPLAIGTITTAVGETSGAIIALDIVESHEDVLIVDITANARDEAHARSITEAIEEIPFASVRNVSDRTFLLHLHGKLEIKPKIELRNRDELSMAYTPGVARVSQALANEPDDAWNLTVKGNSVAIVTDGSAILGLGNLGPVAALPVMEGKAILFKRFADVDAWPICLATQDSDEIVRTVEAIAPSFGGINLEDIAAPRCFDIEERLKTALDIPVFHDDQHGTAIVVLAALTNALKLVDKKLPDVSVALSGTGAAGVAIAKILNAVGVGDVVASDSHGIVSRDRQDLDKYKRWLAENTNNRALRGDLLDALKGADVFIGVSAPNLFEPADIQRMASDPVIFALANPDPEVDPTGAREHAAVVATGRSDFPNQINNVLAFPGVFRGALDARARSISEDMKIAASRAIASLVGQDELRANYIIPSVFNPRVATEVAQAVASASENGRR